tara:strand:- start:1046 stop:1840 length:795 start_codon:yes stop_codon:yes gene_type:complete
MKLKHNKKRNTAFIYEALNRCLTEAIVKKDKDRKNKTLNILKEFFHDGSELRRETALYNSLMETKGLDIPLAERFIFESRKDYGELNLEEIFSQQSSMIKKINKELGKEFFSVFTPNYKTFANISHIFNKKTDARSRVILERMLVTSLVSKPEQIQEEKFEHLDSLTYKMYVKKFNKKYENALIEEQKSLLTMYITSFNDDGVEFRYFLNEEVGRIKKTLSEKCQEKPELMSVLEKFENIKASKFSDSDLQMILKGQQLVKELQ